MSPIPPERTARLVLENVALKRQIQDLMAIPLPKRLVVDPVTWERIRSAASRAGVDFYFAGGAQAGVPVIIDAEAAAGTFDVHMTTGEVRHLGKDQEATA